MKQRGIRRMHGRIEANGGTGHSNGVGQAGNIRAKEDGQVFRVLHHVVRHILGGGWRASDRGVGDECQGIVVSIGI